MNGLSPLTERPSNPISSPLLQKSLSGFLLKPILRSAALSNRLTTTGSSLAVGVSVAVLIGHALPTYWQTFIWWIGRPTVLSSIAFILLGLTLILENKRLVRRDFLLVGVGTFVSGFVFLHPWLRTLAQNGSLPGWEKYFYPGALTYKLAESYFSVAALFLFGLCLALCRMVTRRHTRLGDYMGAVLVCLGMIHTLFFLGYLYGKPSFIGGNLVAPPFPSVLSTGFLTLALLGRLGPGYFPMRPMVGPTIPAVLLRKFLPVTLAAVLIYSFSRESLLVFLSPAVATFITLLLSLMIVVFLVMKSSAVLSAELGDALKETEQRFRHLVSSLKDHGMSLTDQYGQILLWNVGAERLTGYDASEVVGEQLTRLLRSPGHALESALARARENKSSMIQSWIERNDGTLFWAEIMISALPDEEGQTQAYSVVIRDFTERKKADEKLQASLREKEAMLKEIHHRVKNNLQVISSLLRLQSEKAHDKETLALFQDSQERVRSMAMVHEYLYQSNDLARIDFRGYVTSLVRNLCRSYGYTTVDDRFQIHVDEALLNLDIAVPCGLILTELVSNALKYAYSSDKQGPIRVSFRNISDNAYELTVADEGVGLPKEFDMENASSLGLRLVHILTEQLHGQIRLGTGNGTKFIISFKRPEENIESLGGNKNA